MQPERGRFRPCGGDLFSRARRVETIGEAIAALDGIVSFADTQSVDVLKRFASGHAVAEIRNAAAARLMLVDAKQGSLAVADRLQALSANHDPAEMIRMTLTSRDGPILLANALESVTINSEVAHASLNELGSSGLSVPPLVTALRKSGKLENADGWKLTANQRAQLLSEVESKGDAAKGEQIYRRTKMACQKCHAIGGAGGQVGPDLASIGASAQPDYILESLLEPSNKIKENYHSLIIVNDDGRVVTGINLRETKDDLLLRNAENEVVSIPLDSIDERADGGSLMPSGLVDTLTRVELANLVRFLSELGKLGDYALPREKFVRSWEALSNPLDRPIKITNAQLPSLLSDSSQTWDQRFSGINGGLPAADLPTISVEGKTQSAVRFSITNTNPNAIIHVSPISGVRIWKNGQEIESNADITLSQSENVFIFVIDRSAEIEQVFVELK